MSANNHLEPTNLKEGFFSLCPKADDKGMLVRILVSFLATAGLFYVNIMPALVDTLIQALHFTNQQAGLVGSANIYGAALGALGAVFYVQKVSWRSTSVWLLIGLIIVDLISIKISDANLLITVRFIHGVVGGSLVGIGFALIAKTFQPDRTFGMLLVVQFGFGGLGMMFIPPLVVDFGVEVLYLSLVIFSLATLMMVPFIPEFSKIGRSINIQASLNILTNKPLQLTLFSIFLFQAANMGLYAFIVSLGKFYGFDIAFISLSLAWAAWIGIIGSGLVIWLSTRFGLAKTMFAGISLTALGNWALLYSDNTTIWIVANLGVGITWAFVMPYLFGMCAQLDSSGQVAAMGGLASKLGLASGPIATGFLIAEDNFSRAIVVAVIVLILCLLTSLAAAKYLNDETCDDDS